jgi:hypothetical protein
MCLCYSGKELSDEAGSLTRHVTNKCKTIGAYLLFHEGSFPTKSCLPLFEKKPWLKTNDPPASRNVKWLTVSRRVRPNAFTMVENQSPLTWPKGAGTDRFIERYHRRTHVSSLSCARLCTSRRNARVVGNQRQAYNRTIKLEIKGRGYDTKLRHFSLHLASDRSKQSNIYSQP